MGFPVNTSMLGEAHNRTPLGSYRQWPSVAVSAKARNGSPMAVFCDGALE